MEPRDSTRTRVGYFFRPALLLESLPEDKRPLQLDLEYEAEVHRRIGEIDAGKAKMMTLEEVMDSLRGKSSAGVR